MYNLVIDLVKPSRSKRPGIKLEATSITVHNTGNPNSKAKNERGWLSNLLNLRSASWHYCVDDTTVIQAIPEHEVSYHAQGQGWRTSIGVEICESNWEVTRANAVKFLADKLHEKKWEVDKLKQHHDWYEKDCPRIIRKEGWNKFVADVKVELDKLNNADKPKSPKVIPILPHILEKGDVGKTVELLQAKLKSKGYKLTVDGVFGSKTEAIVKEYQKKHGLEADGLVGQKTWHVLMS